MFTVHSYDATSNSWTQVATSDNINEANAMADAAIERTEEVYAVSDENGYWV